MVVFQEDVPILEGITPEMTGILGLVITGSLFILCLYLGYKKKAYEPLKSVKVLTQIAVFSILGFILAIFSIPGPLGTHFSLSHIADWPLAIAYGPYVGAISGLITGSRGFLLGGNWTGPVSNATFGLIIGTLSLYINSQKRFRPLYMVMMMVVVNTWSFGLLHMYYQFDGIVVPMLVVLQLILAMPNNIFYGIVIEYIMKIEQIWDPLTEESTIEFYKDDYVEPDPDKQEVKKASLIMIMNGALLAWFSVIFLSPPFTYDALSLSLDVYQPLIFVVLIIVSILLIISGFMIGLGKLFSSKPGTLSLLWKIFLIPLVIVGILAIIVTVLFVVLVIIQAITDIIGIITSFF